MKKNISAFAIVLSLLVPCAGVFAGTESDSFTKVMSFGTRSDDILRLQQFLQESGYLKLTPNGYYGNGTAKAVEDFQKDQKIAAPYGRRVGQLTLKFLNIRHGEKSGLSATKTLAPESVTSTTAMVRGSVATSVDSRNGGDYQFLYGTSMSYGSVAKAIPASNGFMSTTISNLTCGTTYHYTIAVTKSKAVSTGGDMSFTTSVCN